MSNFDPGWTAHEALDAEIAEQDRLKMVSLPPNMSPLARWCAHHKLVALEDSFAAGDDFALMAAISECARVGLPLPEWVADAYLRRFQRVLSAKSGSWDEVFERPYPKGTHLNAIRKRRSGKIQVWNRAIEIQMSEPDTPIDEAFFERIGKEFNLGKTLAAEYYYDASRMFSRRLPRKTEK